MRTFQQIAQLRTYLRGLRSEGKTVGFVPTMGAFHEGHLSLMRRAKSDCDVALVSLFVNPTQFAPTEDFAAYPRDLRRDEVLASQVGVDGLFSPAVEEIYPPGFQTFVELTEITKPLEGTYRPTHFRGVATVVTLLLNIVQPDRVYFGQKDYQQCLVMERLARDLQIPTTIVIAPTLREPDGLAMSSRNVYLSTEERPAATLLYRMLQQAESLVKAGEQDPVQVMAALEAMVAAEPRATPDYIALVHPETLLPVTTLANGVTLLALAIRIGKTRLLDNALLAPEGVPFPKNRNRL